MYYREIWFRNKQSDQDCFLVSGLPDWIADRLVEALSVEFPNYDWWAE